jgi:addiction module HigA family antidote
VVENPRSLLDVRTSIKLEVVAKEWLVDYHDALEIVAMKNPPHVGGLIRREIIEPLGLTVTEAAKVLGVGRQALSSLMNERTALTTEMGLRMEKAFGPKMEHLMRMQLAFDLAQARKTEREIGVKRYVAKRGAIMRDSPENKPRKISTA